MPTRDNTCQMYFYQKGFEWKLTPEPPSDGKYHTWIIETDMTHGRVCTTAEAQKLLLQKKLDAAKEEAAAQCEEEVLSNYRKAQQQAEGPIAEAGKRLEAASKEVDDARNGVADAIQHINNV